MHTNLKNKKLFLLDMDGTLYLGSRLFDGTLDFLNHVKKIGGRYIFMTNNSSKSVDKYIEKLAGLGIPATRDDFLTSTQATILYLKKKYADKIIYALGTESFKEELRAAGLNIVDRRCEGIACLVMGFDTELTFAKLEDASILLLDKNIDYIATNPDLVCPTEYGYVPDCGSVSIMLDNATRRRPFFIGKPEPTMALLALEKTGFHKDEAMVIGDRIYTDIACGIRAGVTTALVLSGETTMEIVEKSPEKPDFIFQNIREIYNSLTQHQ